MSDRKELSFDLKFGTTHFIDVECGKIRSSWRKGNRFIKTYETRQSIEVEWRGGLITLVEGKSISLRTPYVNALKLEIVSFNKERITIGLDVESVGLSSFLGYKEFIIKTGAIIKVDINIQSCKDLEKGVIKFANTIKFFKEERVNWGSTAGIKEELI